MMTKPKGVIRWGLLAVVAFGLGSLTDAAAQPKPPGPKPPSGTPDVPKPTPPCGSPDQSCCNAGPSCGPGYQCRDGKCRVVCGGIDQSCCPGNACLRADAVCRDNKCVAHCGAADQPCCLSGNACNGSNACVAGLCKTCGRVGLPCCPSGSACESGFVCTAGMCGQCGNAGQTCCGDKCNAGFACTPGPNGVRGCVPFTTAPGSLPVLTTPILVRLPEPYASREKNASGALKQKLAELRSKAKGFVVGATGVAEIPLHQITGARPIENWEEIAAKQKRVVDAFLAQVKQSAKEAAEIAQCLASPAFDMRKSGRLTAVRNQGKPHSCGSCWAHAAVGALETNFLKFENAPRDLSEQQVLDCADGRVLGHSDAGSCDGGNFQPAFDWFVSTGVGDESAVPYRGNDGPCESSPSRAKAAVWGPVGPTQADVRLAVCTYGSVATSMYADEAFQCYAGGNYGTYVPPGTKTNHAVLIVGWDQNGWIIKNSWGDSDWGENGFAHINYGANLIGRESAFVAAKR